MLGTVFLAASTRSTLSQATHILMATLDTDLGVRGARSSVVFLRLTGRRIGHKCRGARTKNSDLNDLRVAALDNGKPHVERASPLAQCGSFLDGRLVSTRLEAELKKQ